MLEITGKRRSLIRFVRDRPGHDRRYAMDSTKIEQELGWRAQTPFDEGLRETIQWYENHPNWVANIRTGEYLKYYERQYGRRLSVHAAPDKQFAGPLANSKAKTAGVKSKQEPGKSKPRGPKHKRAKVRRSRTSHP